MKKYTFGMILCAFFGLSISGCSMMPDDEDIINGSVLENEIFGNDLDDEIVENIESEDEIIDFGVENEDNNIVEENDEESVEVEIQ